MRLKVVWLAALVLVTFPYVPPIWAAWQPPLGIPAPPFGLNEAMPALPSPWTSEVTGFYYVDYQTGIDTRPFGRPGAPRKTIPNTLGAGSVVVIKAGSSYQQHHTSPNNLQLNGTAGSPVWIVGESASNRPTWTRELEAKGSYYAIEQIKFAFTDQVKGALAVLSPSDHAVIRHCEISGSLGGGGGQFASFDSSISSNLVVYDCNIHDNGDVASPIDQDIHGWVVGTKQSNVWFLDSQFSFNSGDGVQINGNFTTHHIYFGRNTSHHNKQSGVWSKRAADVIISQNTLYHHRAGNSSYGQCTGFQYGPERIWIIFNHIYDCEAGIGVSSDLGDTQDGLNSYLIGNVIHDITSFGYQQAIAYHGGTNRYVVNNTVHSAPDCVNSVRTNGILQIHNNIFDTCTSFHISLDSSSLASATTVRNTRFGGSSPAFKVHWGSTDYTSLATWQAASGTGQNSSVGSPGFIDVPGGNFHLAVGSPAIDAGATDPGGVYATFLATYGVSIQVDSDGVARPQGVAWDIGAYERIVPGVNLVVRGSDNSIYYNHFNGTAWVGWTIVGGATADDPALVAQGDGTLDLVVRGVDNSVYHNHFNGTTWVGWTFLPGAIASPPGLATPGGGLLELVVRGADNGIYHNRFNGTAWSGWVAIGGATADRPALVVQGNGTLDLVVRGVDNSVYHNHFNGAAWVGWTLLPGAIASSPALVAPGGGLLELVARGTDNSIYHNRFNGTAWSGWAAIGGATSDRPALVARGTALDLLVRGVDNSVYLNRFDGTSWLGWSPIVGAISSAPALVGQADGSLDVVARGTDNGIYHNRAEGAVLAGWISLGGATLGSPAAVR